MSSIESFDRLYFHQANFSYHNDSRCRQCANFEYNIVLDQYHNFRYHLIKRAYFMDKKLHRIDGPAIEFNDCDYIWCKNGKYHREDGPAVYVDLRKEWWYEGKRIMCRSYEEFLGITKYKAFI